MTEFLVVFSHVIIPCGFLAWLWLERPTSRFRGCATILLVGGYVAYMFLSGAWGWVGFPLRYLFLLVLLVAVVVVLRRMRGLPWTAGGRWHAAVDTGFRFTLGGVFTLLLMQSLAGRLHNEEAVELEFPLRTGVYLVGHGGSTPVINYHNVYEPQQYALDILKLNRFGLRARGLYPRELARYAIYADPVHSPCDGTVAWARDGLPDQVPPAADRENVAGNAVAIACKGIVVYLAHLQSGSVSVDEGDAVQSGQVLGRVGNSGNTSEPHLHIHAETGPFNGIDTPRPGVPLRFDGHFLVRNRLVISRSP